MTDKEKAALKWLNAIIKDGLWQPWQVAHARTLRAMLARVPA